MSHDRFQKYLPKSVKSVRFQISKDSTKDFSNELQDFKLVVDPSNGVDPPTQWLRPNDLPYDIKFWRDKTLVKQLTAKLVDNILANAKIRLKV